MADVPIGGVTLEKDSVTFFEDLYRKYYEKLFRLAKGIVKSDAVAEELVDETYVILLTQINKIRSHPNPLGWLHKVLTNLALNELRKQQRHGEIPLDDVSEIGEEQSMVSFNDALPNGLKSEEKNILKLKYQDQLSCTEIAHHLGISHELSRTRLHRVKKHCAQLMEQERKKRGI